MKNSCQIGCFVFFKNNKFLKNTFVEIVFYFCFLNQIESTLKIKFSFIGIKSE